MDILSFAKSLWNEKGMLFRLAKNDFKSRYAGSFLGILWAYIQPLVTILVFWFVFEKGFRSAPIHGLNYILWFVPAYIPWIFFSDMLISTTNCILEYGYLVKKVKFRISFLPLIKVLSAAFIHVFFILFIFLIYKINGASLSIYNLQAIYYSFSLIILCLGLSWTLCSLSVFFKDLSQIVSVILQIGFWVSPILWNVDTMEQSVVKILKFNPLYYIVNGYRDSFINYIPFWHHMNHTIYFWAITITVFIIGLMVFNKLKYHFADEL